MDTPKCDICNLNFKSKLTPTKLKAHNNTKTHINNLNTKLFKDETDRLSNIQIKTYNSLLENDKNYNHGIKIERNFDHDFDGFKLIKGKPKYNENLKTTGYNH